MRRLWFALLVMILLVPGCPPSSGGSGKLPWSVIELGPVSPLDVPSQAVTIREIGRYSPPDGSLWPAPLDYRGQTVWLWGSDGNPMLIAARPLPTQPEQGDQLPPQFMVWTPATGRLESLSFMCEPPADSWPPIPVFAQRGESGVPYGNIDFAFVSAGGESTTRGASIDKGEPRGLPVIDSILVCGTDIPDASKPTEAREVRTGDRELSAENMLAPLDRNGAQSLVFRNFLHVTVDMPDKSMRLIPGWRRIDLDGATGPTSLYPALEMTYGAELTGFLDSPPVYFLTGKSPFESRSLTFVTDLEKVAAIAPWRRPDQPDSAPLPLKVTGYVPAVRWGTGNETVVFAEHGERAGNSTYIVATMLDPSDIPGLRPEIVWAADVPNMFAVATVVPVGPDRRPYIVCLNPLSGEITVFDPLLGAIRHQGKIRLAAWEAGADLASFCLNFEPDPARPVVFVHDPVANEMIELRIEATESAGGSRGGGIVPLDEPHE